jgi:hypothetical protein
MANVATISSDEYLNMLEAVIFSGSADIRDQDECIDALFDFTELLDASQDDE